MRKFGVVSLRVLGLASLGMSISGAAEAQTAFVDWTSALKPGSTVAVGGVSQEFTYNAGPGGVTDVAPPSTNMAATFTESLSATGEITSIIIKNANRSVAFDRANGDTFTALAGGKVTYARASDWSRQALVANPTALGWAYQSFAAWQSGLGMAAGSMGAASVGAITAGSAVPQTGEVGFTGLMGGIYNDAVGQDHAMTADMGLKVNFAGHTADFWTTNTVDHRGVAYNDLNITGSFSSLPNHPALFGTLATTRLTGTSSAQFYGPAAEEVGGVFTLTPKSGQGLERLAGAFGGKRGAPVTPPVTTPTPSGFTTWANAVKAGATVVVEGVSQEFSYVSSPTGVTSADFSAVAASATFSETFSSAGAPSALSLKTASRTVGFAIANGDTLSSIADGRLLYARSSDWTRQALAVDPLVLGWAYQGFGVWETGIGQPTGSIGGASVGVATAASAVPQTGEASFTGLLGGVYIDAEGQDRLLTADLGLTVYFVGRSADFWTVNTKDAAGKSFDDLNITGGLDLDAGKSTFTGRLSTKRLSGISSVQLYGPGGEEVGGAFALSPKSGEGLERFAGAFGGKRGTPVAKPAPPTPPAPPPTTGGGGSGGGGGGGGGSSGSSFTNWRDYLYAGAVATLSGIVTETSNRSPATSVTDGTLTQVMDNEYDVRSFSVSAPGGGISFSRAAGDNMVRNNENRPISADGSKKGTFGFQNSWQYQTYGVWADGSLVDGSRVGAGSFGALTPAAGLPSGGVVGFTGKAAAIYSDPGGNNASILGTSILQLDFGFRTAQLTLSFWPDFTLRSGFVSFTPGQNGISGPIADGSMQGSFNLRFYGPAANEMGGIFSAARAGTAERLVGAYAGRR